MPSTQPIFTFNPTGGMILVLTVVVLVFLVLLAFLRKPAPPPIVVQPPAPAGPAVVVTAPAPVMLEPLLEADMGQLNEAWQRVRATLAQRQKEIDGLKADVAKAYAERDAAENKLAGAMKSIDDLTATNMKLQEKGASAPLYPGGPAVPFDSADLASIIEIASLAQKAEARTPTAQPPTAPPAAG